MIIFDKVTKKYNTGKNDEITAVDNVSLEIKKGEFAVLKGISGSGKTTLLNLIAAISKPNSGAVFVDGDCISKLPDNFASEYRQKKIGVIFQNYNLFNQFNVFENLIIPLMPRKNNLKQKETFIKNLISKFELNDKINTKIKYLSGGQQQRVAIARALVNNPSIIISDEPTAHLDSKLSLQLLDILKKINGEGKTVIVATHDDIFSNENFRTIKINKGKIC